MPVASHTIDLGSRLRRTDSSSSTGPRHRDRIPALCLLVFVVGWTALAIHPRYPADWLLENLLTFVAVPTLVLTYRRFRFSDRAYIQGTLFLLLHTLGSHYTYSEVPLGAWLAEAFGWSRNHYDRIVHFAFGLLMLRSQRELLLRAAPIGRYAGAFVPFAAITCWSALYEIVEWITAVIVDPAAGTAFLGTQGDPWDAQKDMALACAGALVAIAVEWRIRLRRCADG
jgi:putative membrane protein